MALLRVLLLLLVPQVLLVNHANAQGTATDIVNPTVAASTATVLPSASGYAYAGCYNETIHNSDSRALSGGKEVTSNVMTVELCLSQCANGPGGAPIQFAGVEYGRECYCAQYLSRYSSKINDTASCNYACNGNSSQICGGADALTLYNITMAARTSAASVLSQQAWWIGFVSGAMLFVAFV